MELELAIDKREDMGPPTGQRSNAYFPASSDPSQTDGRTNRFHLILAATSPETALAALN